VDCRSCLEALSCFTGKPLALWGFPINHLLFSFCLKHRLHGLLRNFLANGVVFGGKVTPLRAVDRTLKTTFSLLSPAESCCAEWSKTSLQLKGREVDLSKALTYPSASSNNKGLFQHSRLVKGLSLIATSVDFI